MSTAETPRTRTFHWRDPADAVSDARVMTGLDWLRSIIFDGDHLEAAPIAECLGFRLTKADPGRVVFELVAGEQHYNPIGSVHGGVLATLCDSAAGAAVHSTLAPNWGENDQLVTDRA